MFTYLLDSGLEALSDQVGQSYKLQFDHFKVGDTLLPNQATTYTSPWGAVTFTSTTSNIEYIQHSSDNIILRCLIPHDVASNILMANIVLYLTTGEAFSMSYSNAVFQKPNTTTTQVGVPYVLQIVFSVTNLYQRFDFSNLAQTVATQQSYNYEYNIEYPQYTPYDQAYIQYHMGRGNRLVNMTNVKNQWFGYPFAKRLDDPNYNDVIGGGITGDNYGDA